MKEIKSYYMIAVYLLTGLVFLTAAVLLFVLCDGLALTTIAGVLLGASMCWFIAARSFVNSIEIDKESISVKDFPFLGAKKTLKNEQLKTLNGCIAFRSIESAKIVYLTKEQKRERVGQRHIFNKYVEFKIKNSEDCKYVYASVYSKKQIIQLLDVTTQKKCN